MALGKSMSSIIAEVWSRASSGREVFAFYIFSHLSYFTTQGPLAGEGGKGRG